MAHKQSITHHLGHALHHFMVALVLASVLLICEMHGVLNWLDSLTLRTVGAIELNASDDSATVDVDADRPISLLISDEYFEEVFHQESPLNRHELTRLIKRIVDARPSVIAIDLDLSPGPEGALLNEGQSALDDLILSTLKNEKIPVVLVTPFPVASDALFRVKHAWLNKMCLGGVRVALPDVTLSQGLALRYAYDQPTLGLVASAQISHVSRAKTKDLCEDVVKGAERSLFLSKAYAIEDAVGADAFDRQRPINTDFLRRGASSQRLLRTDSGALSMEELSGHPVFLGSQFDSRDKFKTSLGSVPGTVLHAATFYSDRHPTHVQTHGRALAIDLIFGVVAGFLFGELWRRVNSAVRQLEAQSENLRIWVIARGWQFAAFFTLFAWLAALFISSAWLLSHNSWNNPGPMVLGVFVKTLLASRAGIFGSEHGASVDPDTGRDISSAIVRNLDWIVMAPVVIWAAFLFFSH